MRHTDVTSRKAVISAIAECDRLGRESFLERYGFRYAASYVVRFEGREYDSKAILAVAHKYQFPGAGALQYDELQGGKAAAAGHLSKLGFSIDGIDADTSSWSLIEVQATVDDYFSMLRDELQRKEYNKADHNRVLREKLKNRTKASVELKHQNISAILDKAGLPWIRGYKPRGNVQLLLRAIVNDYLEAHEDLFDQVPLSRGPLTPEKLQTLIVTPPTGQEIKIAQGARRATKIDFAERDARNRKLGQAGEQWVVNYLRSNLSAAGRTDLADQIRWVSHDDGDGLGYDIEAHDIQGNKIFVEVKTTNGRKTAPFLATANEVAVSEELGHGYVLYRVFDFAVEPKAYVLHGPVSESCYLTPSAWKGVPKG